MAEQRPCDCLTREAEKARAEKLFKSARIPKRYRNKTLDNFDRSRQPIAFHKAKHYIENWEKTWEEGRCLFFVGNPGTGKSHLAFAILNELLKKGIPGMCITVPDLMDELRPRDDGQERERMEVLKTIDFLVMDDLGAEKNSDFTTERIYIILNARYSEMRPTVITSNDYLEDLEKRPGWKRIVDRVKEMADPVRVEGESYREEARREKTARAKKRREIT